MFHRNKKDELFILDEDKEKDKTENLKFYQIQISFQIFLKISN